MSRIVSHRLFHPGALCWWGFVQFLGVWLCTSPGQYSPDTSQQLKEALGTRPLTDWQPPIMALIWRGLIAVSGSHSSLLVFELALLFSAFTLLAVTAYVRKMTTTVVAWVVCSLGLFPPILTLAGKLWKDQLMTYLLLLAVALLWVARPRKKDMWLTVVAVFLCALAVLIRANAIFAVVLVLPLAVWTFKKQYQPQANRPLKFHVWWAAGAVALIFLGTAGTINSAINLAYQPKHLHQLDQILLDDIIFSASPADIKNLPVSADFRAELLEKQRLCSHGYVDNTLWTCAWDPPVKDKTGFQQDFVLGYKYHDQFKKAWLYAVPPNVGNYLLFHADAFSQLMFNPRSLNVMMQTERMKKSVRYATFPRAASTYARYNDTFNETLFPIFKTPATWCVAAVALLVFLRKKHEHLPEKPRVFALYLTLAGLLSCLSLYPVVPANDYRYAYPLIVFTALALTLTVGAYLREGKATNTAETGGHRADC